MRKNFYLVVAMLASTFMVSCGGGSEKSAAVEDVLSKKAFIEVISNYNIISEEFAEDLCIVQNPTSDKYGAIDAKGNEVIQTNYDFLGECSEGMIAFKETLKDGGHKYGFINKKGEKVIDAKYNKANKFSDGLALVTRQDENYNTEYAFINKKGEVIVNFGQFLNAEPFSDGLAIVQAEVEDKADASKKIELYGYINTKGEIVIPTIFTEANPFNAGAAIVTKGNYTFIIDKKGTPTYIFGDDVKLAGNKEFSDEGLLLVKKDKKYGFINAEGEVVIPFEFTAAEAFENGKAKVTKPAENEAKELVIDTKGKVVE